MYKKGGKKKKRKAFTRREIFLFCWGLLELFIIVYEGIPLQNIQGANIWQHVFTFATAVVCSILATVVLPRGIQKEDTKELADEIEKRIGSIYEKNQCVLPVVSYVDTNDPNIRFNQKMNESISATLNYTYFSDRALYLTKRLGRDIHKTNNRLKIVVLLADIRDDNLFNSRADIYLQKERALQRENPARTIRDVKDIIREEKLEVLRSLYALGRLKEKYDIRVYLHKEIPFIRFEITDSLLVLSFLTQLSTGKKYPSTVLYENENIFKPNFEDYAKEVMKRAYLMRDEELQIDNLLKLGYVAKIKNCKKDEITNYYNEVVKG